ncbi:hypothetical protein C2845_PM04G24350 [Panicum miliaceum]|uniref:Secreted protein n=1 Tax=Panicum miliaceum TaxID=4540 RepID=A0A3L6QL07_PANMI|nr:hypothetical protein C2845_PM04G24350 [Panicum miliaceum]
MIGGLLLRLLLEAQRSAAAVVAGAGDEGSGRTRGDAPANRRSYMCRSAGALEFMGVHHADELREVQGEIAFYIELW